MIVHSLKRSVAVLAVGAAIGSAGLSMTASAQVGTCVPATADAYLDANNVRARVFGNGGLFYRGEPHAYEVPRGLGKHSLLAASLWLGGLVSGELRMAATRYGPWEFWPGPLGDDGAPPDDCAAYDRLWKVSRHDVASFEAGAEPTADLRQWPTGLGAPTLDSTGLEMDLLSLPLAQRATRVIDLDAGERPKLTGDQMIWWIMNDRGGTHVATDTQPIGVEVHGSAFAFFGGNSHVSNTTFYRFRIRYLGDGPLENAFVSLWTDVDVGDFQDDYSGSDTTLGMAYGYNADDFDGGNQGYGSAPPAIGFDFVRGPVVPSPGDTAWFGDRRTSGWRHLNATAVVNAADRDPGTGQHFYHHMQGLYNNGNPIREGGFGLGTDGPETSFSYPGDPVTQTFWSENNADGAGSVNQSHDQRFSASAGPFRMDPGSEQEVTIAVVWARGQSNIDSITQLRDASSAVQKIVDANYVRTPPLDAPIVAATAANGQVVLTWTNEQHSNNFNDAYKAFDNYVGDTYRLEGYNVIQYDFEGDDVGRIVATYDKNNGVQRIVEGPFGQEQRVVATGTDAGIRHYHIVDGLTNYTTYHFGVQAYAYQPGGYPKVKKSTTTRVAAVPFLSPLAAADSALAVWRETDVPDIEIETRSTDEIRLFVDVINPYEITGDVYMLRPDSSSCRVGTYHCQQLRVLRSGGGEVANVNLEGLGRIPAVVQFDGLSLSARVDVVDVFGSFTTTSNAAGPLVPPEIGALAFNSNGFPFLDGADRPSARQQTNGSTWGVHASPSSGLFGPIEASGSFLDVVTAGGTLRGSGGAYDYEIRFTSSGGQAWRNRDGGGFVDVPFELWSIGAGTPDDPSDDFRMIPAVCEAACGHAGQSGVFDIAGDHSVSGGDDDPFTDPFSWFEPVDTSPGQAGYAAFFAGSGQVGSEVLRDMVLVNWNGGRDPGPYDALLPETGTTFRITSLHGLRADIDYTFDTAPFGARRRSGVEREAALRDIGIVPNPFRLVSAYQQSIDQPEARITNVPAGAIVRVFTLNGSLIRTLRQESDGVLRWDVRNAAGKKLASGMYLIHVEVPGVGERVLKFGVQLPAFRDD